MLKSLTKRLTFIKECGIIDITYMKQYEIQRQRKFLHHFRYMQQITSRLLKKRRNVMKLTTVRNMNIDTAAKLHDLVFSKASPETLC